MSTVRRILDLDPETDARIETLAARKGQDAAAVVADAVELLDSVIEMDGPDVEDDIRRWQEFERTGSAVLGADVKAWIDSWGTTTELPQPQPRKVI
jgi:predicted transcriptional regulator